MGSCIKCNTYLLFICICISGVLTWRWKTSGTAPWSSRATIVCGCSTCPPAWCRWFASASTSSGICNYSSKRTTTARRSSSSADVPGGPTEMTRWKPATSFPPWSAPSSPTVGKSAALSTFPDTTTTRALSYLSNAGPLSHHICAFHSIRLIASGSSYPGNLTTAWSTLPNFSKCLENILVFCLDVRSLGTFRLIFKKGKKCCCCVHYW